MIQYEPIPASPHVPTHVYLSVPVGKTPLGSGTIRLSSAIIDFPCRDVDFGLYPTISYTEPAGVVGRWVSCPDWQLMRCAPGGDYWYCEHGVTVPGKGVPAMVPWSEMNSHYGSRPDYRTIGEVNDQASMANALALCASLAAFMPDEPRLGQGTILPDEIHKMMRLSIGLYKDACRWRWEENNLAGAYYYAFWHPIVDRMRYAVVELHR